MSKKSVYCALNIRENSIVKLFLKKSISFSLALRLFSKTTIANSLNVRTFDFIHY